MTKPCTLVGILDDGWPSLTETARAELAAAGLVIGVRRMLDRVAPHLPPGVELRAMDGLLSQVPEWVRLAHADGLEVAILATGDPLCHGIGSLMISKLGADAVRALPAPSTLQIACARLKRPWQEMNIVSVHSADAGEWCEGATPGHGLYPLVRAVTEHDRVAVFTSPQNGPDRIARALLAAGFGDTLRISVAARLHLPDEALFHDLPLEEAAHSRFPDPNIVLIERSCSGDNWARDNRALFGFEDGDYVQRQPDKGLITKLEARAVSLAKLGLRADSIVWDIGAGAGSVGLEAARIARHGHVFAMEKNAADAANCRENARRLHATNYTLIECRAPAGLDAWPDPDAVFIGGSGGELAELITLSFSRLRPGGRLVMNFATLENLASATSTLAKMGAAWEVVQLSAARSQPLLDMHRLAALNPIWIVSTVRSPDGAQRNPGVPGRAQVSAPPAAPHSAKLHAGYIYCLDRLQQQGITMTKQFGRLIGVSLGPGHPDDITRRAAAALATGARWTYPVKKEDEASYALDIVRRGGYAIPPDAEPLVFPMTTHKDVLARAWARAAARMLELLAEGRDVLFLVEGDASTYATFGHLARTVRELAPSVEVEVLPGVSSYCAAAATVGMPLADADDTLAVIPASYGVEVIDHLLDEFDSLVLLKIKPMLDEVLDLLARRGLTHEAVFVEKVGTPDERVVSDVAVLRGETVSYLSLMLIHNPSRQRPPLKRGCRKKDMETEQ